MTILRYKCDCGATLVARVKNDERAAGGSSVEFAHDHGATACKCLASIVCPSCQRTIRWSDRWKEWK